MSRAAAAACVSVCVTPRMHHRYFECNYAGFGAAFLDVYFKTYVGKFKERCAVWLFCVHSIRLYSRHVS